MTASVTVHQWDGTQVGAALQVSRKGSRWRDRAGDDGAATVKIPGPLITAAQLADDLTLRINDGTADVFEFVLGKPTRDLVDAATLTTEVSLPGPGTRWLLHAGQVRREDTSDCAQFTRERWFGWMSGNYLDTAWTSPVSHGRWNNHPFETVRPKGFPARFAEYLWRTTSFDLDEEQVLFRQTFTVSTEDVYVLCIAADDEYECWLDGAKLRVGNYGNDEYYQWEDFDQIAVKLCVGEHTFAVRGRNLPANVAGQNPGWVIWAWCEAAADGKPAAGNAIWEYATDAEGGSFTLRPVTEPTAATINFDDSATDVQTKLEAILGAGNVTVSGSGTASKNDTYELYIDGGATGSTAPVIDSEPGSAIAPGATPAQVEAAFEASLAVTNVTCNTGTGVAGDPWIIAFDGADAETAFSVSMDDTNLSGGSSNLNRISEGSPYDPWVIETIGEHANQSMSYFTDDTSLVGGDLSEVAQQEGSGAKTIARSDTTSVVHYYDAAGDEPGMTVGEIFITANQEVRDRGTSVFDHITEGFTATHDSNGVAWAQELNIPVSLPADVHRLAELIDDAGVDVWMGVGLVLEAAGERAADTGLTLLPQTVDCGDVSCSEDRTGLENVIEVRTAAGWFEVPDTDSIAARGRWESGLRLDDFDSKVAARVVVRAILDDVATPPRVTKWTVPSEATTVPYQHYGIGARLTGPVFSDTGFGSALLRVDTIEGEIVDGEFDFTVEAVD